MNKEHNYFDFIPNNNINDKFKKVLITKYDYIIHLLKEYIDYTQNNKTEQHSVLSWNPYIITILTASILEACLYFVAIILNFQEEKELTQYFWNKNWKLYSEIGRFKVWKKREEEIYICEQTNGDIKYIKFINLIKLFEITNSEYKLNSEQIKYLHKIRYVRNNLHIQSLLNYEDEEDDESCFETNNICDNNLNIKDIVESMTLILLDLNKFVKDYLS